MRIASPLAGLLALTLALPRASAGQAAPTPEYLAPNPKAAFSAAVRAGPYVFLSGAIGLDSTGQHPVAGGIKAETRAIMEQHKRNLSTMGLAMDRVVKCTAFLVDLADWPAMNEVYTEYFPPGKRPARSAVGVATLLFGARVEIECMALDNR